MKKINLYLVLLGTIFVNQAFSCDLKAKKVEDIFDVVIKCQFLSQEECTFGIAKFKKQINRERDILEYQNKLYADYKKPQDFGLVGESKMTPLELAVNAGMVKATIGLLQNGAAPDFQRRGYDRDSMTYKGKGSYHQYTLLHKLAERSQKQRYPIDICPDYEKRYGLELGSSCVSKEQDYLQIAKLLVDAAGPTLLDKKGSMCHPSLRGGASKLFKTGLITSTPITATQLCGDAPGAVCDYLRAMRPSQVTKEIKEPAVRDEAETNILGMQLRQKQYSKCSWLQPFAINKDSLTNKELVEKLDVGYTICQSSD